MIQLGSTDELIYGILIDTFNPTDPSDFFSDIYTKFSPLVICPIIVVLEEIDTIIAKIHYNKMVLHKTIPIQLKTKSGWNQFFDRFDRHMYPHTIFIMTSNKPINFFDDINPSYFHDGRINIKVDMI